MTEQPSGNDPKFEELRADLNIKTNRLTTAQEGHEQASQELEDYLLYLQEEAGNINEIYDLLYYADTGVPLESNPVYNQVREDFLNQYCRGESQEQAIGSELEGLSEIVSSNQEVFTKLGINSNPDNSGDAIILAQELASRNILLPTPEEHEERIQAGYTPIIVPGHLSRTAIRKLFESDKYQQNFPDDQGPVNPICFFDQANTDWENTDEAKNPTRPKQLYLSYFKLDSETHIAHP